MPDREPMSILTATSATQSISPSLNVQHAFTQGNSFTEPSLYPENTLSALVVDDDYVTRHLMTRLLTRLGVAVTSAENGAIALDLILGTESASTSESEKANSALDSVSVNNDRGTVQQDHRFDIIYLDNQMVFHYFTKYNLWLHLTITIMQPVMSGLDVVRRLREIGRTDFVVGRYSFYFNDFFSMFMPYLQV